MAITKAEKTTQFIIEKVAPVFNTKGYAATSMSDITTATGLTKGAIYGNFENKEELALAALNYNIRKLVWKLADEMNAKDSSTEKLKVLTNYYRSYYTHSMLQGGCPILNVSVDTQNTNSVLHQRVMDVIVKIKKSIAEIVEEGINAGEFKKSIDAVKITDRVYSMIQGAIFSAVMFKDPQHLLDMMNHIDGMVENEMRT